GADRGRPRDARRTGRAYAGGALAEGVRPARAPRRRAATRVHEGGAASRCLGVSGARADAHARLARVASTAQAARSRRGDALRRERVGGGLSVTRTSSLEIDAEERQARLEPLDRDPGTTGLRPALPRPLELGLEERLAAPRDARCTDALVSELLGDASRGNVALDRAGAGARGAEAREGELERGCAHLSSVATTLERFAEPRAGFDPARGGEVVPLQGLRADRIAIGPDPEKQMPALGPPCRTLLLVKGDEAGDEAGLGGRVRPRDPKRHRPGRVNACLRHARELAQLVVQGHPQLESPCPNSERKERSERFDLGRLVTFHV